MTLITTAVQCPFCGDCFENAYAEALHIIAVHQDLEVKIGGTLRVLHLYANHNILGQRGVDCVCRPLNSVKEFVEHLEKAGGMAKHFHQVHDQLLLDRVAGERYDKRGVPLPPQEKETWT